MTDALPWMLARSAHGKNILGCKIATKDEVQMWDAAAKALSMERVPIPTSIFLAADTHKALLEMANAHRTALSAIERIAAAPKGALFAHATCLNGDPVVVVGYDGRGGVRLAPIGSEDSWGIGFEGEVTVPVEAVTEIRSLTVAEVNVTDSTQMTQTLVVVGAMKKGFDRDARPVRYGGDILRSVREGGDWIGHKVGQKRTNEAHKDLARFLPNVAAFVRDNNGEFPVSRDPLLAECVLFVATYFAVRIGRETTVDAYEKWARAQGLADVHLGDLQLSDIFIANGLAWMCPATRVVEEAAKRAAGAITGVASATAGRGPAPVKRNR